MVRRFRIFPVKRRVLGGLGDGEGNGLRVVMTLELSERPPPTPGHPHQTKHKRGGALSTEATVVVRIISDLPRAELNETKSSD